MPPPARSSQSSPASREKNLQLERLRQLRGLMLLAFAVIAFSMWRFGFSHIFTPGWWRLW
ncbi:hypothetical protein [Edaphobacter flagellatus]|uniref:hypothetical protein n=1 Tax=Edaphobacter flagellatus TaxID=1933044 RepID=UPI0021B40FF2|nr:hypothetical protein [Edaphobacter flagellatus]